MSNFTTWWEALSFSLKIYWAIAIPFTFFFILQVIFSFVGGDVPDDSPDVDAEIEGDGGIPFQFLSIKNLIAFFTIFGWVGIAALDSGTSEVTALLLAFMGGLLMMTIMAGIFYFLSKATANGTMRFSRAIGGAGEVYLFIQARRGSIGKVQLNVQGVLRTLDAITDDEIDIPTGKIITVKSVMNGNILVVTAK